ncbi:hypothetical protein ACWPKO_13240 [Coraliomargarita sp. W4R53]
MRMLLGAMDGVTTDELQIIADTIRASLKGSTTYEESNNRVKDLSKQN